MAVVPWPQQLPYIYYVWGVNELISYKIEYVNPTYAPRHYLHNMHTPINNVHTYDRQPTYNTPHTHTPQHRMLIQQHQDNRKGLVPIKERYNFSNHFINQTNVPATNFHFLHHSFINRDDVKQPMMVTALDQAGVGFHWVQVAAVH